MARWKKIRPKQQASRQLNLFTTVLESTDLVAPASPRKAWYRIWIQETDGVIEVAKESGILGKVLDRRFWTFEGVEVARKEYRRRIAQKTNPARRSPRKYVADSP